MTIRLTFELQLHADYHMGAGLRGGPTLDSLLLRDWDNAPLLRGSALAGLLRDGLCDLIALADNHTGATALKDSAAVKEAQVRLFGQFDAPKRWYFDSARPKVASKSDERWGAQEVTRVRINPRTRRAAPNQLFTEEEGDGTLCFQFDATCYGSQAIDEHDALLLIAAARMVRHVGSARRRGRGACTLTVVKAEGILTAVPADKLLATALEKFGEQWLDSEKQPIASKKVEQNIKEVPSAKSEQVCWRIVARTEEPVIISRRSQTANAFEGVSILTGTALLGALATRAAKQMGLRKKDVAPPEFIAYFLRGGMQVSDLLPAETPENSRNLIPAIPMPKSFRGCELYPPFGKPKESHPHVDGEVDESVCSAEINGNPCGGKLKKQTGFLNLSGRTQKVRTREEAHIEIDRKTQRVAEGQLYEYMGIEAGQLFVGEIRCDSAYAERILALTGLQLNTLGELRLGKATRRGYGRVSVWLEVSQDDPFTPETFAKRTQVQTEFTMLLLSDMIATDAWQRFQRSFSEGWLGHALQVKEVTITEQFTSSREVDAFNTHRRQPRWRDVAIEAGSIVRFTLDKVDDAVLKQLQSAEQNGLGLRRAEGFGRIVFNHPSFNNQTSTQSVISRQGRNAFKYPTEQHTLQKTSAFARHWQDSIDDSRKNDKRWLHISAQHEAVARLLYLWQHRPLDQLLTWLAQLGQPRNLWGGNNKLLWRSADPKLHPQTIDLLRDLLKKVADKPREQQAIALELLAKTVTTIARPLGGE